MLNNIYFFSIAFIKILGLLIICPKPRKDHGLWSLITVYFQSVSFKRYATRQATTQCFSASDNVAWVGGVTRRASPGT